MAIHAHNEKGEDKICLDFSSSYGWIFINNAITQ